MKGYCSCGKVIDEVTFSQFGMCEECFEKTNSDRASTCNCQECGVEMDCSKGFHYCPECDVETYFK